MNVKDLRDEIDSIRITIGNLRKEAEGHASKAKIYIAAQDAGGAARETDEVAKLNKQAADYEATAQDKERQAADMEKQAAALMSRKQGHVRDMQQINTEIKNITGDIPPTTPVL